MSELNFKVMHHIGVIKEEKNGWTREMNIVKWESNEPKFDIRSWNEDHTRMSKGITLTQAEMDKLAYMIAHNAMRIKDAEVIGG